MHIVTLRIRIPPNQMKKFLSAARSFLGPTRVQPDCINSRFYQDLEETDTVLFVEEWRSRKALDEHIKAERYRIILSLIDMSTKQPDFKLYTISKIEGIESLQQVRLPA